MIPFEENDDKYTVYVKYRCNKLEWSPEYVHHFELNRTSNCSIDANNITATPQEKGGVRIAWNPPSEGAKGYFVEYSDDGSSFESIKQQSSVMGTNHRFDTPWPNPYYVHIIDRNKIWFRITPACKLGPGEPIVYLYQKPLVCTTPEALQPPTVTQSLLGTHFAYSLPQETTTLEGYVIQVKKQNDSWNQIENEYEYLNKSNVPNIQTHGSTHDYEEKHIKRVARIKLLCGGQYTSWSTDSAPFDVSPTSVPNRGRNKRQTKSTDSNHENIKPNGITENFRIEKQLRVIPNCVTEQVRFSINGMQELINEIEIRVFRLTPSPAELIYIDKRFSIQSNSTIIIDKNLDNGVYVLHVTLPNGQVLIEKFCK